MAEPKNITTDTFKTMAYSVVERFDELEKRIDDHVNQEAEQEAAMEAVGREMRAMINEHSERRTAVIEAAYARTRREAARAAARIAKDQLREKQRITFAARNLLCVVIAAFFGISVAFKAMIPDLGIVGIALVSVYYIGNLVAYATRNNRKEHNHGTENN